MSLFRRQFTVPGAFPGTVVARADALTPKITVLAYDERAVEERVCDSVEDAAQVARDDRVTWIDVRGLGDGSVVHQLGELLRLHPLAISDVVNVGQRPKVDPYEGALFIVLRMVTLDGEGRLHWEQVSLFLGEKYVLTFQESHDDCLEPLRERLRAGRPMIRKSGADYLACMVVDAIVDGYFPVLEHYGEQLEAFEEQILDGHRRDVLGALYLTKRDLAGFRRATWPLREALAQLMREEDGALSAPARVYLRDTLDHTMQVVEVTESYRELTASLVDVHLSMVGQRTNDVMRVLTVVSAIFIPLTFVAGIYGMNFDTSLPLNLPELGWSMGYPLFWAVCLVIAGSLLILFRRLGWLRA